MLIRVAVDDDLARVVDLAPIARQADGARKRYLADRLADRELLVADQDGGIVGYVVQDRSFFERGFVHLLYVGEQHRRHGGGAALLAASVGACGTRRVFTSTNVSNAPMQGLLAARGWVRAGTVDGLDDGDPEAFYYVDADEPSRFSR